MLNRQLILERLDILRNSVNRLNRFRELSEEAFAAHPDNYAIAEHHLRRALECLLDIGRHIVVKKRLRPLCRLYPGIPGKRRPKPGYPGGVWASRSKAWRTHVHSSCSSGSCARRQGPVRLRAAASFSESSAT